MSTTGVYQPSYYVIMKFVPLQNAKWNNLCKYSKISIVWVTVVWGWFELFSARVKKCLVFFCDVHSVLLKQNEKLW